MLPSFFCVCLYLLFFLFCLFVGWQMNEVRPWEVVGCVVAGLYFASGEASVGRALVELLLPDNPCTQQQQHQWSVWAQRCGASAVAALEERLALRSLDEFLDLCEELAKTEPPQGGSKNAVLPLLLRSVGLRLRRQQFHESVQTYENLVQWLRGQEQQQQQHHHHNNHQHHHQHQEELELHKNLHLLDVDSRRAVLAARGERVGMGAAELAVLLAEEGAAPAALAREAAALAAELGDETLVKRATIMMKRKQPPEEQHKQQQQQQQRQQLQEEEDELIKALETRDESFFL